MVFNSNLIEIRYLFIFCFCDTLTSSDIPYRVKSWVTPLTDKLETSLPNIEVLKTRSTLRGVVRLIYLTVLVII